jgi:FKBP-type peptidyl-prolyl cis-trans isomerase
MFALSACHKSSQNQYETTEGGLQYVYRDKSHSDIAPQPGNKLLLDVKYFDEKDSLLFNSQDISPRFIMDFDKPETPGATINDAFAMMHEGDSLSVLINAYKFYLGAGQVEELKKIDSTKMLRFELRLKKILSPEVVKKELEKQDKVLKDEEEYLLQDFLTKNYPDAKPTKSGLYYIETTTGEGPLIAKTNTVAIHYTATYINGEPIYSTYQRNDPLVFQVSDPNVWPCLAEAVQYMRKGGKATIIAPSKLAAGENGDKDMHIAPRKTIVFDLEVIGYK